MTNKTIEITIDLLGKTYQVKCPENEEATLQQASRYLEEKMRQIRKAGVAQFDKIAVIAALNVVYQLLNHETINQNAMQNINQRLHDLQNKVELALMPNVQMELETVD